jgi:hypothetical protein
MARPAATYYCSFSGTEPGFPATWSYRDSFISLYAETKNCWEGEYYYHYSYNNASQSTGVNLAKMRVYISSWEETDGNICSPFWNKDSGWQYNVRSLSASTPSHHYVCSGSGSHYYVAHGQHWFDNDYHTTGYK